MAMAPAEKAVCPRAQESIGDVLEKTALRYDCLEALEPQSCRRPSDGVERSAVLTIPRNESGGIRRLVARRSANRTIPRSEFGGIPIHSLRS